MGKMRDHWKGIKQWSEDVAKGKIDVGMFGVSNGADVLKTMSKFSSGLGPTLDKVEKAYLGKKDADVKKQAGAALQIVAQYSTLGWRPRQETRRGPVVRRDEGVARQAE